MPNKTIDVDYELTHPDRARMINAIAATVEQMDSVALAVAFAQVVTCDHCPYTYRCPGMRDEYIDEMTDQAQCYTNLINLLFAEDDHA